ncbi:LytR/AlgR family response regulator transcription factor [Xylophilus rhododendri]|nr:LytTR family DNA-binding domain-containing protein [Xylophilus rhododendri]
MIARLRPQWRQVAHAATPEGVLTAIADFRPELAVLDIHMGGEGPRWIRRLPSGLAVVFTTVDPSLAVDAFELSATDYVLKPLKPQRMEIAFDRVQALQQLQQAVRLEPGDQLPLETIVASRGSDVLLLHTDEICYLQSDHKYTRVVTAREQGLVRTSITDLEQRLDPRYFRRIHRATLVNLRMVRRISRSASGRMQVELRGSADVLDVSRAFEGVFRPL